MTDGDLVRRALAGDGPASRFAYGLLARRWAARVAAVCHARLGRAGARSGAVEDLAQEALLRGLRALPTLADPDKFGPWLLGIATRTCLDWLKSAQRSEVSLSALTADGCNGKAVLGEQGDITRGGRFAAAAADDNDGPERREQLDRLMREVEALPEPYREVLMLYYYEDCTYADLAKALGVSVATINARLTKARGLLRERLAGTPR